MTPQPEGLAQRIVDWQRNHGRHDLPWQTTQDPYRIWLSEIMLQQTQVATVIPYFKNFVHHFPSIHDLARAPLDAVMLHWAGLGYYSRARNLHRCAQEVVSRYDGVFLAEMSALASLAGSGPATAAAIAAQSYGVRAPIRDGDVKRVLSRLYAIDTLINLRDTEKQLWEHAHAMVAAADEQLDMRAYTQGLMDLGATVCKRSRPACPRCPLSGVCLAQAHGRQHELPRRQARKPVPQRHCTMLILTDHDHVLLERQPEIGLWSNLWSLPQFDSPLAFQDGLDRLGVGQLEPERTLPVLEHAFTHFRLAITPIGIRWPLPTPPPPLTSGLQPARLPLAEIGYTALPAPVNTLL